MIPKKAAILALLSLALPSNLTAQVPSSDLAADSLPDGPYSMRILLEKTIFKVNVLWLDLRFGDEDRARLAALVDGRTYSDALADSVADAMLRSQDFWIRASYVRDISMKQFLEGVDENLRLVPKAGLISRADYKMISEGLPVWYAFLETRGIHSGDYQIYRVRGDTLATAFGAATGETLLAQTNIGPERRLAVLGGYLVEGSEFREKLIRSLFARDR